MADSPLRQLFSELKRRRVYRVAAVYLVVAWGALQLGDVVAEPLDLPGWTMPLLIVFLVVGFPVAVVLAWAFQVTPDGVRRAPPLVPGVAAGGDAPGRPGGERVRNAALIGLGMLIAVLGVGTYAFFHEPGSEGGVESAMAQDLQFLAVLPFANTSADADNEFFADGVMEDILTHLALVPDFAVVSRTTVMRYKESDLSVPQIADELGVRYVLEGSVRRAGERVRITAQLVDAEADQTVWVETYDRNLEDIFAVQTDIATAIAAALETELSRGVAARIERRPTEDLEAYDLFLQGREHYYSYTREGTERSIEAFRAAIARDPDFALARAWLGRAFAVYGFNHGAGQAWGDSAVAHSRRAAEEQPDLAAAHTALGTAFATQGRMREGRAALERAVELNPNDWAAIANLGLASAGLGRLDEAIRYTRMSLEREPARSHIAYANLASYYGTLGLHDESVELADRALALEPRNLRAIFVRAVYAYARDGDPGPARATADRLREVGREDPFGLVLAADLYGRLGDAAATAEALAPFHARFPTSGNWMLSGVMYAWALMELGREDEARALLDEARGVLAESLASGDESPFTYHSLIALHSLTGELDEAYRRLEEAIGLGWAQLDALEHSPPLEALRADPRFPGVYERVDRRRRELVQAVRRLDR